MNSGIPGNPRGPRDVYRTTRQHIILNWRVASEDPRHRNESYDRVNIPFSGTLCEGYALVSNSM